MAAMSVVTIAAAVYLLLSANALFVANALVVPDPSMLVRDGVDGVVEQVKENAGGLVRDGVDGGGFLHDACYIHAGCNGGAEDLLWTGYKRPAAAYCDWDCCNNNGGCWGGGPAWFCNDGGAIDASTVFDRCEIHRNCKYAQFNEVLRTWVCGHEGDGGGKGCYIHVGCNGGAGYCDSQCCNDNGCSMGEGWYCNDGQSVDDSTQYDRCLISPNCEAAKYNDLIRAWVCDEGKFGF